MEIKNFMNLNSNVATVSAMVRIVQTNENVVLNVDDVLMDAVYKIEVNNCKNALADCIEAGDWNLKLNVVDYELLSDDFEIEADKQHVLNILDGFKADGFNLNINADDDVWQHIIITAEA